MKESGKLFQPRARSLSTVSLQSIDGFGARLVSRVRDRWPKLLDDSELRDNPYLLTEVGQIGFKLADRVALTLGIAKGAAVRQTAAGVFILGEAEGEGHSCLPIAEFAVRLSALLGVPLGGCELDERVVEADGMLGLERTFRAESRAAEIVKELVKNQGGIFRDNLVTSGLEQDQVTALRRVQFNQIFCLLGSPGTGKTFTLRKVLESNPSLKIALCAPTGKAAKRIEELTGRPASTIHRLLTVSKGNPTPAFSRGFRFHYNATRKLPHDMVIVDETSMVDVRLFADLLCALRPDVRLLLVGDTHQLPSVGPGRVLADLRGAVESLELTTLKRQDPTLLIARNCARIRDGEPVLVDNASAQDFFFIPAATEQAIADTIVELVTKRLPQTYGLDPNKDIITLTARRDKVALSAAALNVRLRAVLNPESEGGEFEPGDRVIQLHNDYKHDIFNGEIGTVLDADPGKLTVLFEQPDREVEIGWEDKALAHAWALTTHKAQGSEWPWVVTPVHRSNGVMVPTRPHFYTTISRARAGVVVVGDRAEMDAIVGRVREQGRYTRLAGLLK